jgi:lysophospholipase L1-like esterase
VSPRSILKRLVLFCLGTVITLLAIEGVLQVLALLQTNRSGAVSEGDQVRILCVGDSHTFGVYLPAEQSYPQQLERLLNAGLASPRYRVINEGLPGRNTATIDKELPDLLARYRPQAVLILCGLNDRWNVTDRSRDGDESRSLWRRVTDGVLERSRLVKLLRIVATRWHTSAISSSDPEVPAEPWPEQRGPDLSDPALSELLARALAHTVELCSARGAWPALMTYASNAPPFAAVQQGIRDAARATGCVLIDHESVFTQARQSRAADDLLFPKDWHPKPAGYGLMAETIARALFDAGIVTVPPGSAPVVTIDIPPLALSLQHATDGNASFELEGEPKRPFRILLSGATEPPYRLYRSEIPLCPDRFFMRSLRHRFLAGRLDERGHASVPLPRAELALLAHEHLFAAAVTLIDDGLPHHPLMRVVSVSRAIPVNDP